MKKLRIKYILTVVTGVAFITYACNKDFLNKAPIGSLQPELLANSAGVNGLLIGAYSLLDGYGGANSGFATAASNWSFGGVGSDDAYKGSDAGDQPDANPLETYTENASNGYINDKWVFLFDAIQRCNDVLRVMRLATDISPADTTIISAQARFLRAHYTFEAKKIYRNVPFIDENITYTAGNFNVPNTAEVYPLIEADLQYAVANLPATLGQVGRVNVWAAKAYLAKVYMFEHKYSEANTLLKDVIANGVTSLGTKYALITNFFENFDPAKQNNSESVLSVQNSVNDNSNGSNGNWGDVLNFPYNSAAPGGCCGFYQPSQSLVNSYRVDGSGLPYLDTWNSTDVKNDQGLKSTDPFIPETAALDPRLDETIGRRRGKTRISASITI